VLTAVLIMSQTIGFNFGIRTVSFKSAVGDFILLFIGFLPIIYVVTSYTYVYLQGIKQYGEQIPKEYIITSNTMVICVMSAAYYLYTAIDTYVWLL